MAKKKRGYVELYWTCPNCGGENLGSTRICPACGSPQPKDVEFHPPETQQLVTDAKKLKQAKAGADIHCAFCGARNPAGAVKCSQCGSDLREGAKRASKGRVVGAFKGGPAKPIKCPSCGAMNPGDRLKCEQCGTALPHKSKAAAKKAESKAAAPNTRLLAIIGVGVLAICAAVYFLFIRTKSVTGVVTSAEWKRTVAIEAFGPVERGDWQDAVPDDAEGLSCSERVRYTQDEQPSSGSYNEVCGTPYSVETGSGFAEVVQDCEYEVLDNYCSYTVNAWAEVDSVSLDGTGLAAVWPEPNLAGDQRLGAQEEDYVCVFDADGKRLEYSTQSYAEYQQCEPGTTWVLNVNGLGAVQSIAPAN